jgi:hypothetical protein
MLGTLLVALLVAGQPQHSAPRPALLEVASMVRSSQLLILGEAASDTVGLSAVAGAVTGLDEVEAKTHVAQHSTRCSAQLASLQHQPVPHIDQVGATQHQPRRTTSLQQRQAARAGHLAQALGGVRNMGSEHVEGGASMVVGVAVED